MSKGDNMSKVANLFLENKKYNNENYICNVWIDDRAAEIYELNGKDKLMIEIPQGSDVKIEIQNKFFKSNKKGIFMLFYWLLSILTGSGEEMPFGMPFHALLRIENVNQENISIQTNSVIRKEAFLVKSDCNVMENRFAAPKGYKGSWFFGYALPIFLLILAILLVILLVEFQKKFYVIKGLFLSVIAICEIGWMAYVLAVLKK